MPLTLALLSIPFFVSLQETFPFMHFLSHVKSFLEDRVDLNSQDSTFQAPPAPSSAGGPGLPLSGQGETYLGRLLQTGVQRC